MPAELVNDAAPSSAERSTPQAKQKRLEKDFRRIISGLRNWKAQNGNPMIYPDDIVSLLEYPQLLERRVRLLESTLRNLVETDERHPVRADLLTVLYGAKGKYRNSSVLDAFEARIIEAYRDMDYAGRAMLRTLFDRLTPKATDSDLSEGGAR